MTRVANSIDVHLPPLLMVQEDGDCAHRGTTKVAIMDPLFGIQGYERLRIDNDLLTTTTTSSVFLTGVGASLERAITSHAFTFLWEFSLVSLPTDICKAWTYLVRWPVPCLDVTTNYCASPARRLLLSVPRLNQRQKSQHRLCWACLSCTETGRTMIDNCHSDKCASLEPRVTNEKRKWFSGSGGGERVEVLCLTGCTLAESRVVQLELLEGMRSFYKSMVLLEGAAAATSTSVPSFQTMCVMDPTRLLPNETSRMVLFSGPRILGYISNLTDYVTRAVNTQCGSIHNTDYVHTVHGCFCSIRETMDFVLQHNIITHHAEWGVGVPACLAMHHHWGCSGGEGDHDGECFFVPFQRRVEAHRGKVTLTPLHGATHPRWIGHGRTKLLEPQPSTTLATTTKSRVFAIGHKGVPTREDVEAEALMSSFSFLSM